MSEQVTLYTDEAFWALIEAEFQQPDRAIGMIKPERAKAHFLGKVLREPWTRLVANFEDLNGPKPTEGVTTTLVSTSNRLTRRTTAKLTAYTDYNGDYIRSLIFHETRRSGLYKDETIKHAFSIIESEWGVFGEYHGAETNDAGGHYENTPFPIRHIGIGAFSRIEGAKKIELPNLLSA